MTRIAISVEGPTEREFINIIIKPHLALFNCHVTPIVVTTKQVINGPNHKGGSINIDRVASEVGRLIHNYDFVTTFYDFYGFNARPTGNIEELEALVATRIDEDVRHKFKAYVQLHEFECFMFCDPTTTAQTVNPTHRANDLEKIRSAFQSPEDINDSPETAPSKRLIKLLPGYDKKQHGPMIAQQIGLDIIRAGCPRFHHWITWLETAAQ